MSAPDPWPSHLPILPAESLAPLATALPDLAADSIMLWLDSHSEDSLVSVHNPTLPELCGYRQPLNAGLTSQVFLTGLPQLEPDLKNRNDHDPTLDQQSGHACRALIAAPVAAMDQIHGVLTAIQFEDGGQPRRFEPSDLSLLAQLAAELGQALADLGPSS